MSRGRKSNNKIVSVKTEDVFWNNLPFYIKIINEYLVGQNYKLTKLSNSIDKLNFKIPKGLNSSEIKEVGKYPVISQSQEYIIGYSDRKDLLVTNDLPLVLFGDHSKTIKYVNQPFIIGADGIKIIKPKSNFNVKFFYYFLFGVITDTKNYGRHYKLLRNGLIPEINDLKLQLKIIEFLESIMLNDFQKKEFYFNEIVENKIISLQIKYSKGLELKLNLQNEIKEIENLNQAILQEAMQGKLVKQEPKDEPAVELLKRIKVQKTKSDKKDKSLLPIKPEEIPFEIPKNWVWCRLGEICNIVRGGSPRPAGDKTYYDGKIPFLKVGDLTDGDDIYLYKHTYTIKEAGLYKTRFVEANTLLLTNSGATLGYPKICTFPTTFNDGIAAFLNLSEDFDKVYLFYFLKSLTNWFLKVASKGQGQPNLNTDIIGDTLFPVPPKDEQKRIVIEIQIQLDKIKLLKEHTIANQKATEHLLKALLHKAFEVEDN